MEITSLNLSLLNPDQIKFYESFVNAEKISFLSLNEGFDVKNFHVLAFLATIDTIPVGFLLATATESFYISEIQSIVIKDFQNKNIEKALLEALEDDLRKKNGTLITMLYQDNIANKTSLECSLKELKFHTPTPTIYRYFFDAKTFNPNWILPNYRYPNHFSLHFWNSLSENDKKQLKKWEEQGRFPEHISPFINEEKIEFSNSLILKNQELIVGWIITHRINHSTIRYSSLYIDADYRHLGYGIYLLIDAIKIQKANVKKNHPAIDAVFDVNLYQTDKNWRHFIKKRLTPYDKEVRIIYQTWKEIKNKSK